MQSFIIIKKNNYSQADFEIDLNKNDKLTNINFLTFGNVKIATFDTNEYKVKLVKSINHKLYLILIYGDIEQLTGNQYQEIKTIIESEKFELLTNLNGSYSIVVLRKSDSQVVACSDRIGSKPLYYFLQGKNFLISPKVQILLSNSNVVTKLDIAGISQLFKYQRTFSEYTTYEKIKCMQESEILILKDYKLNKRIIENIKWNYKANTKELPFLFADILVESIKREASFSSRNGLLLSGGLDSRLVLAAATKADIDLPCICATHGLNMELKISKMASEITNQEFHHYKLSADELFEGYSDAAILADGQYQAPINLYPIWPKLSKKFDRLFHGYGFDYFYRGTYLPRQSVDIFGKNIRTPFFKSTNINNKEDIINDIVIGDKSKTFERVINSSIAVNFNDKLSSSMANLLNDKIIDENIIDRISLFPVVKHYTSSELSGMNNFILQSTLAYDKNLFAFYLSLPPEVRSSGELIKKTLRYLNPDLANLDNANTNVKAYYPRSVEYFYILMSSLNNKFKRKKRFDSNTYITEGSWLSYRELFILHQGFRNKVEQLIDDERINDLGLFDVDKLRAVIDEHMTGKINHYKFLHILMTLSEWLKKYPSII